MELIVGFNLLSYSHCISYTITISRSRVDNSVIPQVMLGSINILLLVSQDSPVVWQDVSFTVYHPLIKISHFQYSVSF